jgi:antitoxin (DNA-binding transcriptional repressor) of toxin-antitoxin stability system
LTRNHIVVNHDVITRKPPMEFRNNDRIPTTLLRTMLADILAEVAAGKSFVITQHNQAIAVLHPAFTEKRPTQKPPSPATAGAAIAAGAPPRMLEIPRYVAGIPFDASEFPEFPKK